MLKNHRRQRIEEDSKKQVVYCGSLFSCIIFLDTILGQLMFLALGGGASYLLFYLFKKSDKFKRKNKIIKGLAGSILVLLALGSFGNVPITDEERAAQKLATKNTGLEKKLVKEESEKEEGKNKQVNRKKKSKKIRKELILLKMKKREMSRIRPRKIRRKG